MFFKKAYLAVQQELLQEKVKGFVTDKGFVEDGLLVFKSKSGKDYHEEMDGDRFLEWFKNILPKLEPGSVVVMDNAPYHSVKLEKIPTTAWNKLKIMDWLQSRRISLIKKLRRRLLRSQ